MHSVCHNTVKIGHSKILVKWNNVSLFILECTVHYVFIHTASSIWTIVLYPNVLDPLHHIFVIFYVAFEIVYGYPGTFVKTFI